MATKSPGVYFHEIDNTQFTNPKAVSGTVLAVVGYAKKGPIGVPTQINSWKEFTDTFGKPVEGYYSALAVRNFLSSGGAVLFVRVADETASPSNCIAKNAVEAVDGFVTFSRGDDILAGEAGYFNSSLYSFKLATSASASDWKYFFIRTPEEGKKLTQASILTQISEQLGETPAVYEGSISENIDSKLYGFNIEIGEGEAAEKVSAEDFYIQTTKNQSKEVLAQNINSAINYGSNARVEIDISASSIASESEVIINPEGYNYAPYINGIKKFVFQRDGVEAKVEVDMGSADGTLRLKDIASRLNDVLYNSFHVRVFAVQGKDETRTYSKLVFVSTDKIRDNSFNIRSFTPSGEALATDAKGKHYFDLFTWQKSGEGRTEGFVENVDGLKYFLNVVGYKTVIAAPTSITTFTVDFDKITGNIILKTLKKGKSEKIRLIDSKFVDNKELSLMNGTGNAIIKEFILGGQNAIKVSVDRESLSKKIRFFNKGSIIPPVVSKIGDDSFVGGRGHGFKELLDIERPSGDLVGPGYDDPTTGSAAVSALAKDMVVFTSKEKGSGTDNIEVEVFSAKNPVNGKVKRTITVSVNGTLRETYEDVSMNYEDVDNRFDTKINETEENGGSNYIIVKVEKKDYSIEDVELADGIYKIGRPSKPGDKAKADDVSYDSYANYDYTIGKDGIPEEDGSGLFEEAMAVGTSALANKELYDFHILIAPDDITEPVQTACLNLCENRGDAITIVDPPIGLNKKDVINWHNGRGSGRISALDSNYVATYWPWCKIYDTSSGTGKFTWVMPSIVMAAKYVAVDKSVGCQMAPAGETNGVLPVVDIEQYPNALDRDELYVDYNRINPITKFKDGNIVVYGEKTTQRSNSVLTKVHTRRMLIQIKKQCREALKGYIFMPNTADYLGKISNNITAILETYKGNGGLNYYKVICDETNNPTEIRQQDIINVDVVLVPEGTIEQINISLTLNKTAETVTD